MRIAQVSPLFESVPPAQYGGTERIVAYLTDGLVARGHEVTLFASGDSSTAARLEPGCPRSLRLHHPTTDPLAAHLAMLSEVYAGAERFDVIHCHTDYIGLALTRTTQVPTVITLHGRLDAPELGAVYRHFPDVAFVSISDAQRAPVPDLPWIATVPHGLPPDAYAAGRGEGGYLLFLGRMSPEKCPEAAIRVAVGAGLPLCMAAKVDVADQEHFEAHVRPLLDHPLVQFVGEVADEDKAALLGGARALLFPIDWPEPFGLVMIEALACGTPVIARPRGAVPEVIAHGRTGFLCETEDEMVAAVHRAAALRREDCRAEFERRFTADVMVENHLAVYARLLGGPRPRREPVP